MAVDVEFNVEVPQIWYDLIGRIVPGSLLVVGTIVECLWHRLGGCVSLLLCLKAGVLGILVGLGLLGVVTVAFVIGLLLGPLGRLLDNLWRCIWPLRLGTFSPGSRDLLTAEFGVVGTDEAKVDEQIIKAHSNALHVLWTHPEALPLASLASKRDAEKLASGSLAWVALVLYIGALCSGLHVCPASLLFVPCIALSLFAFCHYRRRVVETPLDALAELRAQERKQHEKLT